MNGSETNLPLACSGVLSELKNRDHVSQKVPQEDAGEADGVDHGTPPLFGIT